MTPAGPPPQEPRIQIPELTGDMALKGAAWLVSVAVLNVLVGSPVTDLYVGFSIVATAFWVGRRAAGLFDDPPEEGRILLVDDQERRYRGEVGPDGAVTFADGDGHRWTGSSWSGRWTLEGPDGGSWWGRVGRRGTVRVHDESGRELRGTLTPRA